MKKDTSDQEDSLDKRNTFLYERRSKMIATKENRKPSRKIPEKERHVKIETFNQGSHRSTEDS